MPVESWIQILLAVCTVLGILFFWILKILVSLVQSHEKTLGEHETRITVIEKTR